MWETVGKLYTKHSETKLLHLSLKIDGPVVDAGAR